MHMERPSRRREAEQQAARTILVVWVAFHYFGVLQGLANFSNANVPSDGPIRGVFGKLEPILFDLRLDSIDDVHGGFRVSWVGSLEFSAWYPPPEAAGATVYDRSHA